MARPIPRRRAEREAPDADQYTSRSRRGRDEEPEEETRPRRGRSRAAEPEPPAAPELPETLEELEDFSDDDLDALAADLGLGEDAFIEDIWEAVEKARKPARRGRGRAAEPEDEEPPARGRRSRGELPSRGRKKDEDEDEEEEKPRGRGRSRSSSRDDEEDEGDAPRRTRRAGFEGFKKTRSKTYTDDFKLTPDPILAKFLDDEPFDSYAEHGLYKELSDGQRVWICIEDGCPICAVGHKPKAVALYNLAVLNEDTGEWRNEVLKAGPMLASELETKAALKTGPLTKEYYVLAQPAQVKNEGVKGPIVELVRERDVKDDWDVDPLDEDELTDFADAVPDPDTFVKFPKMSDLKAVARKLLD